MHGRVLVQGPVGSGLIVVASVGVQDAAQMLLTKDNDVVQAFAANGPNQPFGKAILPRRLRRDRFVPNAHRTEATPYD